MATYTTQCACALPLPHALAHARLAIDREGKGHNVRVFSYQDDRRSDCKPAASPTPDVLCPWYTISRPIHPA